MKLYILNEAVPKVKKGLGLSLSKIKMFDACAYRYYLQYKAKEKFDRKNNNQKFFKIGQFAHKYIESKIKNVECKFDSTTMTDEEKEKTMGNCANVFKNKYISDLIDGGGVSEQGFSMYINPMIKGGLEGSDKYSRSADFSGWIDFFAIEGGVCHVVDWKTGSMKGTDDETFMQIMLYAKGISLFKSVKKFKLSFFYVDHNKLVTRDFSIADLDKKIDKIVMKGIDIPTTDNPKSYKATPGKVCVYCPYSKVRSTDNKVPCEYAK